MLFDCLFYPKDRNYFNIIYLWCGVCDKSVLLSSDTEPDRTGQAYTYVKCVFLSSGSKEMQEEDSGTLKLMFPQRSYSRKNTIFKAPIFHLCFF